VTHQAFDIDAAENTLMARLKALQNTAITPNERLLRSVFNVEEQAMTDDETPLMLPGCGIAEGDGGEQYEDNELLGGHVTQSGRMRWVLMILTDAVTRGGGLKGPRGARTVSKQVVEGLVDPDDGWQISPGIPMQCDRRNRYRARDENGELIPMGGYVVEVSHPVYFE
jgi:hypothetical protein